MEAPGPLRGAQPPVELQKLFVDIFDNILSDFIKLSQLDSPGQADRESADQRKYRLLQHLNGTQQQLLRAVALLNWKPWKVLNELVDHDRVLDIAASHVRTMTEVVQQMRQQAAGRIMAGSYLNMYDVNTALEVLTTGTYQELPSIILQRPPLFQPPPASPTRQRARLAQITHLIRARLVQVTLPPGLRVVRVSNGTAVLQAEGLYEAKLTLVPSEPLLGVDASESAAGGATGDGCGAAAAGCSGGGPGYSWTAAGAAAGASDPVAAAAAAQRWKWRLIHFVLAIGVPFYDPRQPGQILNTCNFHMVLAADNAAYLRRQRQGTASGTAGGGGPTASTMSESPATPAVSGLQLQPGAAIAASGSLAAAVRRAEDDEVGAPLAVMHAILTDVAGRLLVDELAAAARALAARGSRWHGHISVKPSQLLHPGVRIEYWTQAPQLLAVRSLPQPDPGEDWRSVKPGPPYLELGMGEGGCVEVLNSPSSLHKPVSLSKLRRLDTFRVNVEEVLMRAANMTSQYQLMQIRHELKVLLTEAKRAPTLRFSSIARQLWCRDGHALHQPGTENDEPQATNMQAAQSQQMRDEETAASGAVPGALSSADEAAGSAAPMDVDSVPNAAAATGGSDGGGGAAPPPLPGILPPTAPPPEVSGLLARAAPEEEVAGALVVLSAPVVEYLVSGTTELKIGKHLFSGRLTLRPGQDERDEGSLDHAATIALNEDYVNQAAIAAYNSAAADSYPAWRALKEACAALYHVLQRTHTSTDATHFIQAARRAALHIGRLPHGLLEAFTSTAPGLAIEPRPREKVATWALQCVPFPPNFPQLEPVAPDTPPLRLPQCLTFFLQSRLSLTSSHVLVVCSCNKQLMPIKVLSCIPVPSSTYRLPDHVVAAYMAASTAVHSSSGGNSNSVHSQHGSAYSPRATANGHEAGGNSPEASPRRDSAGGMGVGGMMHVRPTGASGGGGVGGALLAGPAAVAQGSDAVVAATAGGQASGVPSSSSPPQPHSYSHSQARVPSSGTASVVHGTGGDGGGGRIATAAASKPGPSGRLTGQQVAVMIAQQQLSSVVRWCRRRMVWEVLLVQLKAVGATFVELCNPPCQWVRVTSVAGTALPCYIVRRRGLTPARVGPTCLELELGPDPLAGQITARLYGKFLCSPSCAPLERNAAAATAGAGGRPFATATVGFVLDDQAVSSAANHRVGGNGSGGGGGGSGDLGLVCLQRQYCLERGESALTLVQEVSAVIRMQTLLARLEMTARPLAAASPGRGVQAQRLAILTPAAAGPVAAANGPARPQQPWIHHHPQQQQQSIAACSYRAGGGTEAAGPVVYGDGAGAGAGAGYHALQPAAKRIKTEPGCASPSGPTDPYSNGGWCSWQQPQQPPGAGYGHPSGPLNSVADGHAAGVTGHGPGGHVRVAGGSSSTAGSNSMAGLTWHWPLVGTLTLEDYSCSTATLRVAPGAAGLHQGAVSAAADAAAMPPPPLLLHITWAPRDVRDSFSGGGGGGGRTGGSGATPGTSTPAPITGGINAMSLSMPSPLLGMIGGVAVSPLPVMATSTAPYPSVLLPPDAGGLSTRLGLSRTSDEPFGSQFCDLVWCTISCSSGHSLPRDYLQVLEELAEAGEEGKLLDAVAVAAWPVAGFCAALRPSVLSRHGLQPDMDVRLTMQQPPFCLRIVCRKRSAGGTSGSPVLIDLICLAVGRSFLRVSAPMTSSAAQQQQLGQGMEAIGGLPERQSTTGISASKAESGASTATAAQDATSPSYAILASVQQQVKERLGDRVHVSVGGRASSYTGLGHRPAAVPGPTAPLWLLVPQDCVQQAVELVYGALG